MLDYPSQNSKERLNLSLIVLITVLGIGSLIKNCTSVPDINEEGVNSTEVTHTLDTTNNKMNDLLKILFMYDEERR